MSSAEKPSQAGQPKQKSITSFFCKTTSTPAAPAHPSNASPSSSSSLKASAEKASAAKGAATSAEKEKQTPTNNNTSNTANSSGKKPRQQTQRKPRASSAENKPSASKKSAAKAGTASTAKAKDPSTHSPAEEATTSHNAPTQETSPSPVVVVDMSGAEVSRDSAVSDVFASMERETDRDRERDRDTQRDTHTHRERRESDLGLSESDVGEDHDIDRLVSTQTHTHTQRETLTLTYSQASISSEGNTVNMKAPPSPSPLRRSPPTLSSPVFSPPQTTRRTPREALSSVERENERLLVPCELSSFYVSPAATNVSAVCVAERDAQRVRESVTSMGVSESATLVEALRRSQRESEREKERARETVTLVESDSNAHTDTQMDTHTHSSENGVHAVPLTDTHTDAGSAEVHTATQDDAHTITDTHTDTHTEAPVSETLTTPSHNSEGRGKRTPKPVRAFDPTPVSMRCVKPKAAKTASVSVSDKTASDANTHSESVICVDIMDVEEEEEKTEREKDEEYTDKATPSRSSSTTNNSNTNTAGKKSRSAKKDKESSSTGEKEKEKEKEKELTPEQKQRIEKLQERMLQAANDMAAVEKCDDMRDNRLELDDLVSQFRAFVSQPHSTQTQTQSQTQSQTETETASEGDPTPTPSPPQTASQPQTTETVSETASDVLRRRCREFVRVVLARCVQGSARPLSQLAQEVCETLRDLRVALVRESETNVCESETERERLSAMLLAIDTLCGAPPQSNETIYLSSGSPVESSGAIPLVNSAPSFSLAAVCEEVKTVAQRESLGVRPAQCASPFEDDSPTALWRWEVFPPHSATLCCVRESSHTALREAKQWRGKCARVVRLLAQLVAHTLTAPPPPPTGTEAETVTATQHTEPASTQSQSQTDTQTDTAVESSPAVLAETSSQPQTAQSAHTQHESKRALLEERLGKAVSEVEKYKERRRALEAKKTEKDAKLAEKEAKKAAALEAKKNEKEAKLAEKEAKKSGKTEVVKRQQNALLGFLRVQAPAKTTTQAQTTAASSHSPLTVTHTYTHTAVSSHNASTQHTDTQDNVACVKECDERERRRESFLRTLLYGSDNGTHTETHTQTVRETALSEILAEHQRLRSERERERREMPRPHRTVRIMVTVTAQHTQSQTQTHGESLFAEDPQCELCERVVSRRVKTLRFHEDVRPAYVGTHTLRPPNSRNSNTSTASLAKSIVTGRTPLAKDLSRLDYEYDSEADWSDCEGDDGEDLGLTDDEEDEENDDLEYDDMFRRDDDFGSDEEDGLCDDPRVVRASCVEEVLGPLWLSGRNVWYDDVCGNNNSHTGVCVSSSLAECVLYTDTLGEREEAKRLACFPTVVFAHTLSSSHNAQSQSHTLLRLCGEREGDGAPVKKKARKNESENACASESNAGDSMKGFDETKLGDLLRTVHGRKDGIEKLIALFVATHTNMSKAAVRRRIGQVAEKTKDKDGNGSARFVVKKELLEAHCPELLQSEVAFTPVSSRKKKRVTGEESATESAKKKQPRLSLTQTPTKAQTQTQPQTTSTAVTESERERKGESARATVEERPGDKSPTQTQTQTQDDDDCMSKNEETGEAEHGVEEGNDPVTVCD